VVEAASGPRSRRRADKPLLSLHAVVDAGLAVLRRDGLDAVTMRRVATALDTGPASLYVYVAQREALLDAMLDRVLAEVPLVTPDPARWRAQIHALMSETVAALLRHPGIARAGLANIPIAGSALRIREAMLGTLLAGGIDAQGASWAIDVLPSIALTTALETGRYAELGTDVVAEGERIVRAYAELSPDDFPATVANLATVTAGTRVERFRFAVDTILDGLLARGGAGE
jgi:AcrR family transcriptional regulator